MNDPKRPDQHRHRQLFVHQRLQGWPLNYTPASTISAVSVACLVAASLGAALLSYNAQIIEVRARYDSAGPMAGLNAAQQQAAIKEAPDGGLLANVWLSIDQHMQAPIYLYYELNQFYGNHKRFVRSVALQQLLHAAPAADSCDPQQFARTPDGRPTRAQINPCGLRAWSYFNDSFSLARTPPSDSHGGQSTCGPSSPTGASQGAAGDAPLHIDEAAILRGPLSSSLFPATPPQHFNTQPAFRGGGPLQSFQSPHFLEWMRLSSHPTTRKLYAVLNESLPAGTCLRISVANRYNSYGYNSEKSVVLSTLGPLGLGRNPFLGVLYVAASGCLLLATAAVVLGSAFMRKRPGDLSQLSWNRSAGQA
ncbi:MAG: hypothetical protein WDW36_007467 [Sanguina aurantia]